MYKYRGGKISTIEELLAPNRYYSPEMVGDPGVRSASYTMLADEERQHFFFTDTPPDIDSPDVVWRTVAEITGPVLLHSLSMTTNYRGADSTGKPTIKIYWRLTLNDRVFAYRFGYTTTSQHQSNVSITTNNDIADASTSGLENEGYLDKGENVSLKLSNAIFANHIKYEVSLGRRTGFETAIVTQIETSLKYQLMEV